MDLLYVSVLRLLYLALAILFGEMIFALCQKPSETQKQVFFLIVSTILMLAGYCLELQADSLSVAKLSTTLSYLGKPFIVPSAFLFLCSYYNRRVSKGQMVLIYLLCGFFTVAVATNDQHHLFYAAVSLGSSGGYSQLSATRGPLYYVYTAFVMGFTGINLWVIFSGYHRQKSTRTIEGKRLTVYSTLMIAVSILSYVIYLLGLTGDFDFTVVGVFFSVLFLFLIFIRCRVLSLVSLAKDHALDNSPTALFVLDTEEEMVYRNRLARELSDCSPIEALVRDLAWEAALLPLGERIYSVKRTQMEVNGIHKGRSVELVDVTDAQNYQIRLEHDIEERTEQLETVQRKLIGSFASMVEARSLETGEHIHRTSAYARLIALSLRERGHYREILTDDYINLLVSAMPLHDVGKIAISDAILLKPGKLTQEEFAVMKTHSETGAQLIEKTMQGLESEEYLQMATNIARYHHERFDGTGYPSGKREKEIPLEARIAALADCFDAIRSPRCYKPAMDLETAKRVVQEEAGTHFEPAMVEALLAGLEA